VEVVRTLLGAWWEDKEESVFPPPLINGNDLKEELKLSTGPIIGYLLESIREAQVAGDIQDRQEALNLARVIMEQNLNTKTG
jgi:hypothetical protein